MKYYVLTIFFPMQSRMARRRCQRCFAPYIIAVSLFSLLEADVCEKKSQSNFHYNHFYCMKTTFKINGWENKMRKNLFILHWLMFRILSYSISLSFSRPHWYYVLDTHTNLQCIEGIISFFIIVRCVCNFHKW